MLGRACSAMASYFAFGTCCWSCGVNVSFWMPCTRPSVRTTGNAQTYRETYRFPVPVKIRTNELNLHHSVISETWSFLRATRVSSVAIESLTVVLDW